MPERSELEALLTDNLEWVDRVAIRLCRRNGLDPDEVDEFLGEVRLRLVENDYAILRKFRGESAVTTYLTVVVTSLFRDYRVSLWGRWRSSAAAKREGELAIRLEMLVYRDGFRVDQAGEILRAGGHPHVTDADLLQLLKRLPEHATPRVHVGGDPLDQLPDSSGADQAVLADEEGQERHAAEHALGHGVEGLPEDDRRIVRLWMQGTRVADIARALHMPQKPLYRRLDNIFAALRVQMERAGITREQVRGLLDEEGLSR
ncbi:MAG TPA: sigma-70 family RNA polymerase sigma factor [Armatimonadota bacterium]|nr:sigma-70 family RNA polymerase sigma factor [Armatimonadota bacterium]